MRKVARITSGNPLADQTMQDCPALLPAQEDSDKPAAAQPAQTNAESRWRDKKGIAAYFGVSPRHITNLQRRRILPFVKFGRVVRFDVRACDEAAKALEMKSIATMANQARCPAGHN